MTDLRTAAQAVLDSHVFGQVGHNAIQALRQALAEPVEPVAWMTHHDEPMLFPTEAEALSFCDDDETPIPLYTTPPSVDALIADLMELHLTWEDYQDVKEVCDKYRGVK